jgi:hypothetical protein
MADSRHHLCRPSDLASHSSHRGECGRNAGTDPLVYQTGAWGCVKEDQDMDDRKDQNPSTGSESDISKSQSQRQPSTSQDREQQPDAEQSGEQAATGQDTASQSGFGETATEQRSDIEGSSLDKKPTDEGESGFVGSEGKTDTSSELIEDEDQKFRKDGQGAPEGK